MTVSTFFDSQTWAGLYAYNHVLIILTIVISSYFLAKKVQLQYSSYKFKNEIDKELGYVSIAIDGLKKHYKYKNDSNKTKSYAKVKNISVEMVFDTIDVKFDNMHEIVEKHRQELKYQVQKIVAKECKKENKS